MATPGIPAPPEGWRPPPLYVHWDAENKKPFVVSPSSVADNPDAIQYMKELNDVLSFRFFAKPKKKRDKDEDLLKRGGLPLKIVEERNDSYHDHNNNKNFKRTRNSRSCCSLGCFCDCLWSICLPRSNNYLL